MTLTGVPLILLAAAATAATAVATAWLWRRAGRWRPVTRTLGVLLTEVLVVLTAGLVVNRHEQFYPSWAALFGHTGTITVTRATEAGRLDRLLPPGRATAVLWQPIGLRSWRLAGPLRAGPGRGAQRRRRGRAAGEPADRGVRSGAGRRPAARDGRPEPDPQRHGRRPGQRPHPADVCLPPGRLPHRRPPLPGDRGAARLIPARRAPGCAR